MKLFLQIIKVGTILPLFLFQPVQAQNENFGLNFTPQAGINFSYCGLDAQENNSFKISPEGGIKIKLDLTNHFGITTGVGYTQKAKYYQYRETSSFFTDISNSLFGSFIDEDLDSLIYDVIGTTAEFINDTVYSYYSGRVNMHYIQVPLMATFDVKNFSFSAGAYIGFKIGVNATETLRQEFPLYNTFSPVLQDSSLALVGSLFTFTYPALEEPVVSERANIDFVKSVDYGLMAEIAGRFDQRFSMYANATYGLSNYSNNPVVYPGKHFTVSFGMGMTLGKIKGTSVTPKFF